MCVHTPCLEEWIVGLLVLDHKKKKKESSIIISSGFHNAVQSKIEGHKWEGVSVWLGGQGV